MLVTSFFSNYQKAGDITSPKVVTIDYCAVEKVGQEQQEKLVLHFQEPGENPLILNFTNGQTLAELISPDCDDWGGQQIELYTEMVSFGTKRVPGIRVRLPNGSGRLVPKGTAEQTAAAAQAPLDQDLDGDQPPF